MENIKKRLENLLLVAWSISLIATVGSLFFSEGMEFIPCKLCWYQRIAMYPQVILLGITFLKKDYQCILHIIPISAIGLLISLYHYVIQNMTFANKATSCGLIPCNAQYIDWFGFVTISFLSFVSFFLLTTIQISILLNIRKEGNYEENVTHS